MHRRGSKGAAIQIHDTASTHTQCNALEGILVEGEFEGRKASCSGFIFGGGRYALTQGALLSALQADVTPLRQGELLRVPSSLNVHINLVRENATSSKEAQIAAWWSCPLLSKTSQELRTQGWQFTPDDTDVLGLMLVLSVGNQNIPLSLSEIQGALLNLLKEHVIPAGPPSSGSVVMLESTPFASSSLFLNSWTRGVVSAVTGERDALILCDVHAAPGCEGGALYAPKHDLLLGIVILPFCIVRGESVALCLCAALGPVLIQLFRQSLPPIAVKPGEF